MKRGTILKLAEDMALLWVHGVSNAVDSKRKYYQGKRRIPAPLVIHRHAGQSDLAVIGEEILGLSKMNWTSFDLYTKLPATVESSRQIARIGSLLDRFGSIPTTIVYLCEMMNPKCYAARLGKLRCASG